MSPVYKLSDSSLLQGRQLYTSMLAGNTAYVEPGDFESIQTVAVGSGGSATISFTSLPTDYQHLQIRFSAREESGGGTNAANQIAMRFNSDSGDNYSLHRLFGDGSTVASDAYTSSITSIRVSGLNGSATTANSFSGGIIDILDYQNTNKRKTVKSLAGTDLNDANGRIFFSSGCWENTAAITSITITSSAGVDFNEHSHFALYGIKG